MSQSYDSFKEASEEDETERDLTEIPLLVQ